MFEQMKSRANEYITIATQYDMQNIRQELEMIVHDIERDDYTFIVLGEFSNGKSSFINALIGNSLLPTGITPTTSTINILRYGQPQIDIHYKDGSEESTQDVNVLNQFIASKLGESNEIDYVNVYQPLPFLKERIVIVDTPGLNDISETRTDITYNYIPRADVVFFLIDARKPLKETEYLFLTEQLLKQGLEKIIFIVNFADCLAEDELTSVVERVHRELQKGLNIQDIEVIPFSTVEALEGITEQDKELLEISGVYPVKKKIEELCISGTRVQSKAYRYNQRLDHAFKKMYQQLEQQLILSLQSKEQLTEEVEKIQRWKKEENELLYELEQYYEERLYEFKKMSSDSIDTFFEKVEDELIEEIHLFQGTNMQHFFEQQIPARLRRQMKQWIEKYSPHLHTLIQKLEMALGDALSEILQEKIYLKSATGTNELAKGEELTIDLGKRTDPLVASGLIVGGTSALFLMVGGPILVPIIGMVGLPYLQKKMIQEQLEQVKPEVINELQVKLLTIQHDFEGKVHDYLDEHCKDVWDASITSYEARLQNQEKLVQQRLNRLQKNEQQEQQLEQSIQKTLQSMQKRIGANI